MSNNTKTMIKVFLLCMTSVMVMALGAMYYG